MNGFPNLLRAIPAGSHAWKEEETGASLAACQRAIPVRSCCRFFLREVRWTVERWAGNGGQMAEVKRKKLELVGKEQERRPRKKNPCSGCDLECSTCLVSGARTMREAACRTVKQKSAEIADWLGTNAANGDVNSTKLLLSLAGPQTDKGRTRKSRSGGTSLTRRRRAAAGNRKADGWVEFQSSASNPSAWMKCIRSRGPRRRSGRPLGIAWDPGCGLPYVGNERDGIDQ